MSTLRSVRTVFVQVNTQVCAYSMYVYWVSRLSAHVFVSDDKKICQPTQKRREADMGTPLEKAATLKHLFVD